MAATISSWQELQREAPAIIERLNDDQPLARASAANPLFGLEELGYEIVPSARAEIEARLRFGPRRGARALKLRHQMQQELGHDFDPDDLNQLHRVIVEELRLRPPKGALLRPLRIRIRQASASGPVDSSGDPLEQLRDAHPIIPPLLEYRKLATSSPRLAPRDAFDAIRQGERWTPITGIRGRLKRAGFRADE